MANRYVCVPALVLAVLLPSCVTVVKDEPQQPKSRQLVKAESQLIQPFAAQSVIIADDVLIEISPDLDPEIGRPAGGTRRKVAGADEFVWHVRDPVSLRDRALVGGRLGTPRNAQVTPSTLRFLIRGTVIVVTGKIRLRILHNAPPTLNVRVAGDVRYLTDNASVERRYDVLVFKDGRRFGKRPRATPPRDVPRKG